MKTLPWLERWGRPKRETMAPPAEVGASGVRSLPRPAIRWVGSAGRIALRPFDWVADADAVCQWQEETYGLNFPDFEFTADFAAAFRHDLRRATLDGQHGVFMLDDGAPCGFLWVVVCSNNWTGERYGYINNIFIAPARRGSKLGAELIKHAEAWFRSRRVRRVRLTVTASNAAACGLYEGLGYAVTRWEMERDI